MLMQSLRVSISIFFAHWDVNIHLENILGKFLNGNQQHFGWYLTDNSDLGQNFNCWFICKNCLAPIVVILQTTGMEIKISRYQICFFQVDEGSGFHTKTILCMPIRNAVGDLIGKILSLLHRQKELTIIRNVYFHSAL